MMCEHSSCHVLNVTTNFLGTETLMTTATATNECKCQAPIYVSRNRYMPQQLQIQQNPHGSEYSDQQQTTRKQFPHLYGTNNQKTTNVKILQQVQPQIPRSKSMNELTFPTNYKATMHNHLNPIKSTVNNSNLLTKDSATLLESSSRQHIQQQLHEPAAMDCTMPSTSPIANSSSSQIPTTPSVGADANTSPSNIGVNLRVTGQCSQGGRKYMEDYFSVAYQQSEDAKDLEYAFIGIYDGHGGAEAATFAKEHLMMQIINQKAFWSDSDQDVLGAIREGYIGTHYAMWRQQENWPKTANGLLSTAGTTATIAFIRREKIYIGHVGDSGIVLGYQNEGERFWRAKQLTVDHKPESMEERARIQRSGGKVVVKSGVPRVVWNRPRNAGHRGPIHCNTPIDEVPFLAVARSLGDLWSYNSSRNVFVVSPDPDVQVIKINPNTFRCLIFGTDGLWNVVTPQEAVDTVHERESINECLQAHGKSDGGNGEWTNPSKGLVERALRTWAAKKMRADNTSVVTVILYPPGNVDTSGNYVHTTSSPHNSVSNVSCGLEYTEVCAEAPTKECYGITYEEIAGKYTMPELFRECDYFLEEDGLEKSSHPEHAEYYGTRYSSNDDLSYWRNWHWKEQHSECAGDYNYHSATVAANSDVSICNEAIANDVVTVINPVGSVVGDEDENAVDGDHGDNCGEDAEGVENEEAVLHYMPYNADTNSNAANDATNEFGNAGFMTFAESYNSFLNEQMSNSSHSNSNCQIISGTNEILQEQQLYQQQCMSEEEGYSLTKLETRREQQRCSGGVKMFKIFQAHDTSGANYVPQEQQQHNHLAVQQPSQRPHHLNQSILHNKSQSEHQLTIEEARELEAALTWEPNCPTLNTTLNHFMDISHEHQKPLELNSLLQQEREEEQQVAYERLEMQRQLAHGAGEAERPSSNNLLANNKSEMQIVRLNGSDDVLMEEYIDDECESVPQQRHVLASQQYDTSVQINEVSSSIGDQTIPSLSSTSDQMPNHTEKIEKIEILQPKLNLTKRLGRHSLLTHKSPPLSFYKRAKTSLPTSSSTVSTMSTASPSIFTSRPPKACPGRTSLKRLQAQYPNIPNENSRLNGKISARELSERRCYDGYNEYMMSAVSSTISSSSNSNHHSDNSNTRNDGCRNRRCRRNSSIARSASNSCVIGMEKRQLRSNSVAVDYSMRTLRTRNSLTKDLKAKASLTTTMRRVTTQFLHNTAVSLMQGNSALAQQREARNSHANCNDNVTLNSNSSNICTSGGASAGSSGRKTRAEKLLSANTKDLEAAFSHVINLRSRKVAELAVAAAAAVVAVNSTQQPRHSNAAVVSPLLSSSTALRRERHNLRSLNARNATSVSLMSANVQREYAYGKAKRNSLQTAALCSYSLPSTSTPTSKLLHTAGAVTSTTRQRAHTLLMSKQTAGSASTIGVRVRSGNAASTTTQPTCYGKRTSSLRSNTVSSASTSMMSTRSGRKNRRLTR